MIDARGYGVLGDEPSATRFSWRYEPLDKLPGTNVHAHFVLTATARPNRLARVLPFVDEEPKQSVWTSDEGRITFARGRPATGSDPALR